MPDDGTEQTPSIEPEQSTPAAEQESTPVADGGDGSVADGVGAVAAIDWSNPDSVRGVLENPEYKAVRDLLEEARLNGENAGKQRTEAELRRRAATDEQITEWTQRFVEKAGISSLTPAQQAELVAALDVRGEYVWTSKLRGLAADAMKFIGEGNPDVEASFQRVFDDYGSDEEAWRGATNSLVLAVRDKGAREARQALEAELMGKSSADLRKDPLASALLTKWLEDEQATEALTQQRIAGRQAVAPRTSIGTPVIPENDRYLSMGPAEASRLPEEEYAKWQHVRDGVPA